MRAAHSLDACTVFIWQGCASHDMGLPLGKKCRSILIVKCSCAYEPQAFLLRVGLVVVKYLGFKNKYFRRESLLFVAVLLLGGCNHSPSQDILGSFFPAWMLCAAIGILAALIIRQGAIKAGIHNAVPAKLIIYTGLAISLTFFFWLGWFGN